MNVPHPRPQPPQLDDHRSRPGSGSGDAASATRSPTTLDTILVGVDGSPGAARALAWATARAGESGATIVAVHVLTASTELRRDVTLDTMTTWRRTLERCLRGEWTATARASGAPVRCLLVHDDTASAGLLTTAAGEHADLIVLGAQGHDTLTGRLLGATTYKVTHRAHTPVVVVPPP
jgi:nucleotide-binding universal stress UspA family protein